MPDHPARPRGRPARVPPALQSSEIGSGAPEQPAPIRCPERSGADQSSQRAIPVVEQLRDIVGVLANASTADRRAVYDELGVSLTYHPETKSIEVGAGAPHVLRVGVGGGNATLNPRHGSGWVPLPEAA